MSKAIDSLITAYCELLEETPETADIITSPQLKGVSVASMAWEWISRCLQYEKMFDGDKGKYAEYVIKFVEEREARKNQPSRSAERN